MSIMSLFGRGVMPQFQMRGGGGGAGWDYGSGRGGAGGSGTLVIKYT